MITIHTDGGSRGNPGPAAIGVVIEEDGTQIAAFGQTIGTATNNEAEYKAVIEALQWIQRHKKIGDEVKQLALYLDSELVVRQLNGAYKVKEHRLFEKYAFVKRLIQMIGWPASFTHIPREENTLADSYVNAALDGEEAAHTKPYAKRGVYARHRSYGGGHHATHKNKKNWY